MTMIIINNSNNDNDKNIDRGGKIHLFNWKLVLSS